MEREGSRDTYSYMRKAEEEEEVDKQERIFNKSEVGYDRYTCISKTLRDRKGSYR